MGDVTATFAWAGDITITLDQVGVITVALTWVGDIYIRLIPWFKLLGLVTLGFTITLVQVGISTAAFTKVGDIFYARFGSIIAIFNHFGDITAALTPANWWQYY